LQTNFPLARGSQKGDIYSLGILLYEIYGRIGPCGIGFSIDLYTLPKYIDIIEKLKNFIHIRPPINNIKAPDCIKESIVMCWHKNPEERPDIRTVRMKLKELERGMYV
jgi:guanylate cyclase, other